MTRRILLALVIFATLPTFAAPPDLNRLSFLIGTWDADGGAGSATFERALNNHMIVRKSWATIPASGGKPASRHEDLMIIFPYGDHLRAAYYDSNGYVVGYEVEISGKNHVVLTSDKMQGVPRARLTYDLGGNGVLAAKVDYAPADKPDAFAPSMAWNSKRK